MLASKHFVYKKGGKDGPPPLLSFPEKEDRHRILEFWTSAELQNLGESSNHVSAPSQEEIRYRNLLRLFHGRFQDLGECH